MVYCLVLLATRTCRSFSYFKSVQIRPYVAVPRDHACEIVSNVYFHIQSISLSFTAGKYSFVICPFVVWSHSLCHFSTLLSSSSLITTLLELPCSILWCLLSSLPSLRVHRPARFLVSRREPLSSWIEFSSLFSSSPSVFFLLLRWGICGCCCF